MDTGSELKPDGDGDSWTEFEGPSGGDRRDYEGARKKNRRTRQPCVWRYFRTKSNKERVHHVSHTTLWSHSPPPNTPNLRVDAEGSSSNRGQLCERQRRRKRGHTLAYNGLANAAGWAGRAQGIERAHLRQTRRRSASRDQMVLTVWPISRMDDHIRPSASARSDTCIDGTAVCAPPSLHTST
jgi:hypothetical protein